MKSDDSTAAACDRHRRLGRRQCLCGDWFAYTTKRPNKASCGRYCVGRIKALQDGARRGQAKLRHVRWRSFVTRAIKGERISFRLLLEMCADAYRLGYNAGRRPKAAQ